MKRDCGNGDFSNWTEAVSFTTASCYAYDRCKICFKLLDTWGDSWAGAGIEVIDLKDGRSLGTVTRPGSENDSAI